jgi:hypothetical protein
MDLNEESKCNPKKCMGPCIGIVIDYIYNGKCFFKVLMACLSPRTPHMFCVNDADHLGIKGNGVLAIPFILEEVL